jgi:hypothetical protein
MNLTLETAKSRADKELAHLTTERKTGTPKEKEWPVESLTQEIRSLLELFVKHGRTTALSPNVAQAIYPISQLAGPAGPKPFGTDMLVKVPSVTGPISTSAHSVIPNDKQKN